MISAYEAKLVLNLKSTNDGTQKNNDLALKTYKMITAGYSVIDKLGQIRFFEKTCLLADNSIEIVLGMFFLSLNNVNIKFIQLDTLTWWSYNTTEALPTTC